VRTQLARYAGSRLLKRQPDQVLVELARQGHEPAFEAIVARYRPQLVRIALRAGPAGRAEDAVQQALLQAYRALRAEQQVANVLPWLRRIVLNSSVDLARRAGPPTEAMPDEEMAGESVESVVERRRQLTRLIAALRALPDRQRDVLVMRELEGRDYDEIASELGASNGAVRQLLRRARTRLRTGAAALVSPALLVRMLTHSAQQSEAMSSRGAELAGAGGLGVGAKLGAALAASGSALLVGSFVPLVHELPQVPHSAGRGGINAPHPGRARAPITRAERTQSWAPPAERTIPSRPEPPSVPEQNVGRDGANEPAASAEAAAHDGEAQSQAGDPAGEGDLRAAAGEQGQQGGENQN
jgi:RNA polymerase sigma factor (sigma-70 family)